MGATPDPLISLAEHLACPAPSGVYSAEDGLAALRPMPLLWRPVNERAQAINGLRSLPPMRSRMAADAELALDELVSNGLRGGPVALGLGVDTTGLDVCVVSSTGPAVERCLAALARALRDGGRPAPHGDGAGLGLYLVLRRCAWLQLSDEPSGRFRALAHVTTEPKRAVHATLSWSADPGAERP